MLCREELSVLLSESLQSAFGARACVGCKRSVYWNPSDASENLTPDVFVRLGASDDQRESWKVWQRGAPHVAIEIVPEADGREPDWDAQLERYRKLGVRELVRFAPEAEHDKLRVWDCFDGDLVERELDSAVADSSVLPGFWLLVMDPVHGATLRLSQDEAGERLYPLRDQG